MSNWCLLRGFTALQRLRLRGRGSWRRGWNELQRLLLFFYRRSLKQILWHNAALQGSNPVFVQVQKNRELTGTISTWSYFIPLYFIVYYLSKWRRNRTIKWRKTDGLMFFHPLDFRFCFKPLIWNNAVHLPLFPPMISRRARRENEPEQGGGDWGEETRQDGSRVIVEEVTEESRRNKRKEEMGEEGCEWKRGDERRGKAMFLSVCPVANLISLATP